MRIRIGRGERWAILAAVSYTGVNVILRMAAPKIDPYLGSALRLLPLFVLAWAVVFVTGRREFRPRDPAFLSWRFIGALAAGGAASFLVGNVFFFQALASGGLGITVNAAQGGSVFAGIAFAWAFLRERPRSEQLVGAGIVAIGLACVAIAQLGSPGAAWYVGLAFALLAGGSYATSNVFTRLVQRTRPILFVTLAANTAGGLVPLIVTVGARSGWDPGMAFAGLVPETVGAVLLAGCMNAAALVGLTQAMKDCDVATTNTISSSQIVFSFLASVLFFGETGSPVMVAGVALVVAGIAVAQLDRRRRAVAALTTTAPAPDRPSA